MIFDVQNKKIFASDAGRGLSKDKHTLVLIHGSGLSHIVWSLTEQYLSNQGFNVLSIDLPGHGNSEGNCINTIEKIADWLEEAVISLDLNDLSLIGHSQGCLISQEYAYKYPKRIKKIIFVAGSYKIPVNKDLIGLASAGDMKALNLMMKWGYGDSKRFIGGNPVQKIINSPREVSEILSVDLTACNNYKNGLVASKSVKCPTLFIFGDLDKMITIEKGKEFASLIPNSKTHIIKDCGHMIMYENAFEMREKISEFLK